MALSEAFNAMGGGLVGGLRGDCAGPGWAAHSIAGDADPGALAADVAGGIFNSQRSPSANVASVAACSLTGVCVCYV